MAIAKCGTGNPASYDDIDAVMFTQNYSNGQDNTVYSRRVATFDRSTFWVFFWNNGREELPTEYSQLDLKDGLGTFKLSTTLEDVRSVLQRHDFFHLNPTDLLITDTMQNILYVKRCGVITTIRLYKYYDPTFQDRATLALFDNLRSLVKAASATRTSKTPKDFEQTLIFNP
jgi:hypothetical protein